SLAQTSWGPAELDLRPVPMLIMPRPSPTCKANERQLSTSARPGEGSAAGDGQLFDGDAIAPFAQGALLGGVAEGVLAVAVVEGGVGEAVEELPVAVVVEGVGGGVAGEVGGFAVGVGGAARETGVGFGGLASGGGRGEVVGDEGRRAMAVGV